LVSNAYIRVEKATAAKHVAFIIAKGWVLDLYTEQSKRGLVVFKSNIFRSETGYKNYIKVTESNVVFLGQCSRFIGGGKI
jgi:hypothetical protein